MSKKNQKSYLYIAEQVDVKGREISIKDKKIGITNSPTQREQQLAKTKMPTLVSFVKLYELDAGVSTTLEKQIFHNLLSDRHVVGEWYDDEEGDLIPRVSKTMNSLMDLGVNIKDIDLLEKFGNKLQDVEKVAISKAKEASNQIYLDRSMDVDITDEDDIYSLWVLTDNEGFQYAQIYNPNTTRGNNKKANHNSVANYCNSDKFLSPIGYDRTKIKSVELIISSNDKNIVRDKMNELKPSLKLR